MNRKGGKQRRHAENAKRMSTGREDVSRETCGIVKQRNEEEPFAGVHSCCYPKCLSSRVLLSDVQISLSYRIRQSLKKKKC